MPINIQSSLLLHYVTILIILTLLEESQEKPQSLHDAQHLKDSEAAVQQEILDTKASLYSS